jgi:predicted permease
MEFLGFLFEIVFFTIGLYFYFLLSGKVTLKGSAAQQLALFKQNAGALKLLSLVLALFGGVSLVLHLMQFFKK